MSNRIVWGLPSLFKKLPPATFWGSNGPVCFLSPFSPADNHNLVALKSNSRALVLMDANMKDDCRRSKLIRVLLSWMTLDDLKRSHSCFKEIPLKCQKQEQFGCLSE